MSQGCVKALICRFKRDLADLEHLEWMFQSLNCDCFTHTRALQKKRGKQRHRKQEARVHSLSNNCWNDRWQDDKGFTEQVLLKREKEETWPLFTSAALIITFIHVTIRNYPFAYFINTIKWNHVYILKPVRCFCRCGHGRKSRSYIRSVLLFSL